MTGPVEGPGACPARLVPNSFHTRHLAFAILFPAFGPARGAGSDCPGRSSPAVSTVYHMSSGMSSTPLYYFFARQEKMEPRMRRPDRINHGEDRTTDER